jgi:hypothetical protein
MGMRTAFAALGGVLLLAGCKDLNVPNYNAPSVEALTGSPTRASIAAAAQGMELAARTNTESRVLFVGIFGREAYDLRPEEPRPTTERLIGPLSPASQSANAFWPNEYQRIQAGQILLAALDKDSDLTDQEKAAVRGYTQMVMAQSYWDVIMMHQGFGAVLDPSSDPRDSLKPIVADDQVWARIFQLMDSSQTNLQAAGSADFPFQLTDGYADFNTPAKFVLANRALSARFHKYHGDWNQVLQDLSQSFMDTTASLDLGVYHDYSTVDGTNPYYQDRSMYAHPRFRADAQLQPGGALDQRALDKTQVVAPFSLSGFTSTEKFTRYGTLTAELPWIRNEELILLHAEASLATNDRNAALADVNLIRTEAGKLAPLASDPGDPGLLHEILYNKFMSLIVEGGYTYFDLRQYGLLASVKAVIDTGANPGPEVVYDHIPFPDNECLARSNLGTGTDQPCGTIAGTPLQP